MTNADVIVLGAGIVGVSTALHLQKRGRSVVLVDRRGAGEETSYGNTGIIQREGVVPYPFPRQPASWRSTPSTCAPRQTCTGARCRRSHPGSTATGRPPRPRAGGDRARSAAADRALRRRARGAHDRRRHRRHAAADGLSALLPPAPRRLRRDRQGRGLAQDLRHQRTKWSTPQAGRAGAAPERPERRRRVDAGAVSAWPIPGRVARPTRGYSRSAADVSCGRRGARSARAERLAGAAPRAGSGAKAVVVALGPWSDDVLRPLGYRIPLGVKRGYHMHFKREGNATLNRPVIDVHTAMP